MKQGLTEIVFILDRSGSMSGLEKDTIGGFNSTIEKQKQETGEAYVSTVLFDTEMEVLHDRVPLARIEPLTDKEYYARGGTALLDAIETARNFGIDESRAANFVNDGEGIKTMYMAECCLMSDIRNNRINERSWKKNVDADYIRRGNHKR